MASKKNITLLIVMHDQFESIDFFISLFNEEVKSNSEIIFAFDRKEEEVPSDKLALIKNAGFEVLFNEENIGKLNTVINASHKIKTPFFKIVDQDDSIDPSKIEGLNNELSNVSSSALVKHVGAKIFSKDEKYFVQSLDEDIIKHQIKIGKDVHWAQQVNCDTIYPTEIVRKMQGIGLTRQNFHNDVLMSNFCLGMTKEFEKIKSKFYIHLHNGGQTSTFNVNRAECVVELYENYILTKKAYPEFSFRKLMWGMKVSHVSFAKTFTKWYVKNDKDYGEKLFKDTKKLIKVNWRRK